LNHVVNEAYDDASAVVVVVTKLLTAGFLP